MTLWLAIAAAFIQAAALVVAVPLWRRLRCSPLVPALMAVGLLMTLRRLLPALAAHPSLPLPMELVQDGSGLLVSLLLLLSLVLVGRRGAALRADETQSEPPSFAPEELQVAREEEREILSYDLHDGLAQYVLAAQMHLDTFRGLRTEHPEQAEAELTVAATRVREAVGEVHRLLNNLSSTIVDGRSLSDAVARYLPQIAEEQGWEWEVHDRLEGRHFGRNAEAMAFRVIQEALTNAAKHAGTERVSVLLHDEDGCLVASVRDWGKGFDLQTAQWNSRRLGLRGMCNRARLLGGSCHIDSQPGQGTRVTIRMPGRRESGATQ